MAGRSGVSRNFAAVMQVGFTFIVNTLAFVWIGRQIDRFLSTGGLLTALFLLLGVASSFAISFAALKRIAGRVPPEKR